MGGYQVNSRGFLQKSESQRILGDLSISTLGNIPDSIAIRLPIRGVTRHAHRHRSILRL